MAKQRYISSDFWVDDYIQEIPNERKLLYIYLFTNSHVDLCGIYKITLKTMSFESGVSMQSLLKGLEAFQLEKKILYKDGWVLLKSFQRHLKTNPNVEKGIKRSLSLIPSDIQEAFQSLSKGSLPIPIPNGTNLTEQPIPKPDPKESQEFVEFWNLYPRKTAKGNAIKAWRKISSPAAVLKEIKTALAWQTKTEQWTKEGGQFIPHPATYLNARRWEDEPKKKEMSDRMKRVLKIPITPTT